VLFASVASLGPALWLTALNVKYRDFRYIIPFIVQFGLYISPVGFSSAVVPEKWRIFYYLNPVVGPIDGFRWCLLQAGTPLNQQELLISLGVNVMLLILGISYFRATERGFADVI
jgi:lipopolysaccharide transport system permease protein